MAYQPNIEKTFNIKYCKNYLSDASIIKLLNLIKKIYERRCNKKIKVKDLNNNLLLLNKKNKKQVSNIYNEVQYTLFREINNFKLLNEKFLNKIFKKNNILVNVPTIRFDFPNDNKYILPWHQEIKSSGKFGFNNFFQIWCPLNIDANKTNGALVLKENPKKKIYNHSKKKTKYLNEMIQLNDKRTDKFISNQPEVKRGDAIMFFPTTIHKSGYNTSNELRLTLTMSVHVIENKKSFPKLLIREI